MVEIAPLFPSTIPPPGRLDVNGHVYFGTPDSDSGRPVTFWVTDADFELLGRRGGMWQDVNREFYRLPAIAPPPGTPALQLNPQVFDDLLVDYNLRLASPNLAHGAPQVAEFDQDAIAYLVTAEAFPPGSNVYDTTANRYLWRNATNDGWNDRDGRLVWPD